MANAMLEDEFKSSHPGLTDLEDQHREREKTRELSVQFKIPTRKSVEFAISEPPAKRNRPNVNTTAKQIVTEISTSVTRKERLEALQKAKNSFQHDIQAVHDDEITAGADSALIKHLTFLAFHTQQQSENLEELLAEITLTCDALESLLRASAESVAMCFDRMGHELLQLLVGVIDNELSRRNKMLQKLIKVKRESEDEAGGETPDLDSDSCSRSQDDASLVEQLVSEEGDLLLRKTCKIVGHFARVGKATKPMAHFPGLLGVLLSVVSFHPHKAVPWDARLSALWTIANLACNAENMQMMACTPHLIESLIEVSSRALSPAFSLEDTMEVLRSRSLVARALLNLSWSAENKIILAEHPPVLDLLLDLMSNQSGPFNQSRTIRGVKLSTRQFAIGALRNLAAAPRRIKIFICEYNSGIVLDTLTDAALNDPDDGVKERAVASVHNLAMHDTAPLLVKRPALVLLLKGVLSSGEDDPHNKDSPKSHASATLRVLKRSITPEMDSFENLQDLLSVVNPQPTTGETATSNQMIMTTDNISEV